MAYDYSKQMNDPSFQLGVNLMATSGANRKRPSLAAQLGMSFQQMMEWQRKQKEEERRKEYMEMIEKAMRDKAPGKAGTRIPYAEGIYGLDEVPSYLNNYLTPW